ncbi:MAG: DUF503 domain-containing protein [bacterium]|nr:DUF503 domain-containing protein [bacterium]
MHIGLLRVELYLPVNHSLKGKRQILKSIKDRVRALNISIAEVAYQDSWQQAMLASVTVANDQRLVHQTLMQVVKLIASEPDCEITAQQIEML